MGEDLPREEFFFPTRLNTYIGIHLHKSCTDMVLIYLLTYFETKEGGWGGPKTREESLGGRVPREKTSNPTGRITHGELRNQ